MGMLRSYWRELVRTYLGYLAAGSAFIPGGFLYAVLRLKGWESPVVAIGLLLPSFWLAHKMWAWALQERATVVAFAGVRQTAWMSPSFAPTFAAAGVAAVVTVSLELGPATASLSSSQEVTSAAVSSHVLST